MAVELATAYVSIVPSMKGVQGQLAQGLNPAADAAGKDAGAKVGGGLTKGVSGSVKAMAGLVSGAAIVGAGKALYGIGATFDDVADTIRVGTGATGKALDGLVDSAKNVGKSIPTSFEDAGSTVADLNTRLGLTGPTLETLSKQFLEAGRITGQALDINTVTAAFSAFDVQGADTSKALDQIYQVSQATGIGINELATNVKTAAPNLKQFGFSIGDSAALIGTLDKAGLDSNKTLATLSRAMVEFAKEGKEPKKALKDTVGQIEAFTKSGNDAAAINLAAKIFGTRGASQFVAAVKSGKVNLDDLMGATGATSDTILGAASETNDFAESWLIFKNKVLLGIEPIATRVFNAFGSGMALVNAHTTTFKSLAIAVGVVVAAFGVYKAVMAAIAVKQAVQLVATKALAAGQWLLNAAMSANPITLVVIAIAALVAAVVIAWKNSETFRAIVIATWEGIKAVVSAVVGWFTTAIPAAWNAVTAATVTAWNAVAGAITGAWAKIKTAVSTAVSATIAFIKDHWGLIVSVMTGPLGAVVVQVIKHWEGIKAAFSGGIKNAVTLVKSLPGKILDALGNMGELLVDAGKDVIKGFLHGITGMFGAVKDTLGNLTGKLTSWKGPPERDRKILRPAGRMVIGGFVDGLEDEYGSVRRSLSGLTTAMPGLSVPAAPSLRGGGSGGGSQVVQLVVDRRVLAEVVAGYNGQFTARNATSLL